VRDFPRGVCTSNWAAFHMGTSAPPENVSLPLEYCFPGMLQFVGLFNHHSIHYLERCS
jgi:hypothetical protein